MESNHYIIIGLLCISLTLSTSGREVPNQNNDEVIVYALPYDFDEYSAFTANSYATTQWVSAVYSGLVKRSSIANGNWIAEAAISMPIVSSDRQTFTFTLRNNLYFSNNEPLSAEDVEFSMKIALHPLINYDYSHYIDYIDENSMIIHSSTNFSITLIQPHPFPYELLSFPIIPQETFKERYSNCVDGVKADCTWNAEDGSDAIGSGPFMVYEIDNTNEIVTLVANPLWWNAGTVKTDKIIFQKIAEKSAAISSIRSGNIDILDSQYVPALYELNDLSGIFEGLVGTRASQEMSINHIHPYIGTGELIPNSIGENNQTQIYENARKLRLAMSMIMDRQTYVDEIFDGLALTAATNMPSGSLGWDNSILAESYNLIQARDLMTQLGFNYSSLDPQDPTTGAYSDYFFSITTLASNTGAPARNQWPSDYVTQLPKLGIGVTPIFTGWSEIISRTIGSSVDPPLYANGGYDVAFIGFSWDLDWNPEGLYDALGSCSNGTCANFYNFDLNETMTPISELVKEYLTELDFDTRMEIVSRIQRELHYWNPVIPILYPMSHWAWRNNVHGMDFLLLSASSQQWEYVYKDGFENNPTSNPKIITSSENKGVIFSLPLLLGIPTLIVFKKSKPIFQ